MSKFLDQTGLSHFWSKIKTLLAGKAEKNHTHTGYASSSHNHNLADLYVPYSQINTSYVTRPYMGLLRACRTFALPADQVIVEQSTDGGATWTAHADSSDMAWITNQLFTQSRLSNLTIPLKNGKKSCSCMLRVTITAMKYNVPSGTAETSKYNYWNSNYVASNERYCNLDFGYFWISSNADKMVIIHEVATGDNPNNWVVDGRLNNASGWSGGNYVTFGGYNFGGATNQTGNYWNHRFTFRTCASDGSYDDSKLNQSYLTSIQSVREISCYGQNCWTASNNMMKSDRPYTVNESNQSNFDSTVISSKGFAMSGVSEPEKRLLTADGGNYHLSRLAAADHTHDSFDGNVWVGGVLDADAGLAIGGEMLTDIFAEANHTHSDYVTTAYLNQQQFASTQYVDEQVSNTVGLVQGLDDRVTEIEQGAGSSSASCQFKIMTRKTLSTNGGVNLSTYINNSSVSELMIIVRAQTTAAVTLGISNVSTASSSGFIASKSLGTGISYTKIILSKTDEGYYMWDVNGSIGFSNDPSYVYLRNYSATSGAVTSMTAVIHYR